MDPMDPREKCIFEHRRKSMGNARWEEETRANEAIAGTLGLMLIIAVIASALYSHI